MSSTDSISPNAVWYIGRLQRGSSYVTTKSSELNGRLRVSDIAGPLADVDVTRFTNNREPVWQASLDGNNSRELPGLEGFVPVRERNDVLPMRSVYRNSIRRKVTGDDVLMRINEKMAANLHQGISSMYILYISTERQEDKHVLHIWSCLPEPQIIHPSTDVRLRVPVGYSDGIPSNAAWYIGRLRYTGTHVSTNGSELSGLLQIADISAPLSVLYSPWFIQNPVLQWRVFLDGEKSRELAGLVDFTPVDQCKDVLPQRSVYANSLHRSVPVETMLNEIKDKMAGNLRAGIHAMFILYISTERQGTKPVLQIWRHLSNPDVGLSRESGEVSYFTSAANASNGATTRSPTPRGSRNTAMSYSNAIPPNAVWYIGRFCRASSSGALQVDLELNGFLKLVDILGPLKGDDVAGPLQGPEHAWSVFRKVESRGEYPNDSRDSVLPGLVDFATVDQRGNILVKRSVHSKSIYRHGTADTVLKNIVGKMVENLKQQNYSMYILFLSTEREGDKSALQVWSHLPNPQVQMGMVSDSRSPPKLPENGSGGGRTTQSGAGSGTYQQLAFRRKNT